MSLPFKIEAFRPRAPWFGGDLQTLRNKLVRASTSLAQWPGEEIKVAFTDGSGDQVSAIAHRAKEGANKPAIALVHGLTGSAASDYILNSAAVFLNRGHHVVRLNMRAAGPELPLCQKLSHAGKTEDLKDILEGLPADITARGVIVMGFSLGGNMTLKFAGEGLRGGLVKAVISVSAPVDLNAAQMRIHNWRNKVYHHHLIKTMKADALSTQLQSDLKDAVRKVDTIYGFDEHVIAPLHGFKNAQDYYAKNSAQKFVPDINIPCLIIHASDDPWIPVHSYESLRPALAKDSYMTLPRSGGHVGFHDRNGHAAWHDRATSCFLDYLGL